MQSLLEQGGFFLFLVFFFPGFVSLKFYDLLTTGDKRDFSRSLLDAIAYSFINFIFLIWFVPEVFELWEANIVSLQFWFFNAAYFIAGPVLWPYLFLHVTKLQWFSRHLTTYSLRAWDRVFGLRKPNWIIVHLQDGRKVGGIFAENSYASSYPAPEQIYLEKVWQLDTEGKFEKQIEGSRGMLILDGQIAAIELFNAENVNNEKNL